MTRLLLALCDRLGLDAVAAPFCVGMVGYVLAVAWLYKFLAGAVGRWLIP